MAYLRTRTGLDSTSEQENVSYIGKRTTKTQAGDYPITDPGWYGAVLIGVKEIALPNPSVLLLRWVLVEDGSDLATADGLMKQPQLTPLSRSPPLVLRHSIQ